MVIRDIMLDKKESNSLSVVYKFYNHVSDIPLIDWKSVNYKNNIYLDLRYIKTLEDTLSETMRFKFILFYRNDIPIAIAVSQFIKINTEELRFHVFPCKISETIRNYLLKEKDINVLICGNLFSCGEHGFVYDKTKIEAKEAFENLSNALDDLRKSEELNKPSFILLKEYWQESYEDSDCLKENGFREFKVDVNMVLQIKSSWNTFEDYLASMRTKFRSRANNVFRKSATIQVIDFTPNDINNFKTEINNLYLSVIEKADFNIEKLSASTFRSLKQNLKDKFIFKAYFLNEKLVGFTSSFIFGTAVEANHIGIDYNFNKEYAIYQRMLYDYVALAIATKKEVLRLGRTAEIIKSCVGAKPLEMKLYVKHGNSISNTLLKPLVDLISPSEYEVRNPFKLQLD